MTEEKRTKAVWYGPSDRPMSSDEEIARFVQGSKMQREYLERREREKRLEEKKKPVDK